MATIYSLLHTTLGLFMLALLILGAAVSIRPFAPFHRRVYGVLAIIAVIVLASPFRGLEVRRLEALKVSDPAQYEVEMAQIRENAERKEKEAAALEVARKETEKKERLAEQRANAVAAAERKKKAERTAELNRCSDDFAAYVMAKAFVTDKLKAPSTADFARSTDSKINSLGCGKWRVTSYVDAQNAFGAMLRSHYVAELQFDGAKNWQLVSLQFASP